MATHKITRSRVIRRPQYGYRDGGHWGPIRDEAGKHKVDVTNVDVVVTIDEEALATFLANRAFKSKSGTTKVQGGLIVAKITKRDTFTTTD